jgi:uncharacterized protein (DUF362 family)
VVYIDNKPDLSMFDFQNILYELDLNNIYKNSRMIVIKVNLTSGSYIESSSHAITSMEFLKKLIIFILDSDPLKEIYIAESDDSNYGYAFLKFEHLNIPQIFELNEEQQKRVHILDLSRDRLKRVQNHSFKYFTDKKQLWLSETLLKSDFTISLTNLKTHREVVFTGACKNLFGVLPEGSKWIYHPWIHNVIHDTVIAVKPSLSIVDGFYAMEGSGPVKGEPVDLGFRLWSDDPVQADIQACNMVGIKALSIKYLILLSSTLKLDHLKNEKCEVIKKQIKRPRRNLCIPIGLFIQSMGTYMQQFGCRVRSCSNLQGRIKEVLVRSCPIEHEIKEK